MYTYKKFCRICNNDLIEILDLKIQPLANEFIKKELFKNENMFPLKLMLCNNCFLSQLSIVINPTYLFKNYIYLSGTTNTNKIYFKNFCNKVIYETKIITNRVLDIACNDGSQLDFFKLHNFETYGIEPAINLYDINIEKGHNIICDFWNTDIANSFKKTFDIIIAQNVFAHVDDVYQFLNACKLIMHDESNLYIQTSQANMIENNQFDTIYHEHLSFFTTYSMKILSDKVGLFINHIEISDWHGGSYLFKISKQQKSNNYNEIYNIEKKQGRYNISTYIDYKNNIELFKTKLNNIIHKFKDQRYKLIGFGAAAKGNTLLNFCQIKLDYIVDENKLKQNLYSPGLHIIIRDIDYLINDNDEKIIIILAWNFYDEIKNKLIKYDVKNYKLLSYYPQIKIE